MRPKGAGLPLCVLQPVPRSAWLCRPWPLGGSTPWPTARSHRRFTCRKSNGDTRILIKPSDSLLLMPAQRLLASQPWGKLQRGKRRPNSKGDIKATASAQGTGQSLVYKEQPLVNWELWAWMPNWFGHPAYPSYPI